MAFPTTLQSPATGGITPSGALGAQLQALTRRAVVPSVFVQIYQTHPVLSAFLANAQTAKGGFSQITIPAQGASFVQFGWGSFAGDFAQPSDVAAIQDAYFNLKLGMVPIGFYGMEAIIQSSEVIVPKLKAVMSDSAVVIKQAIAQALYSNNQSNQYAIDSLYQAYDDGTNVSSYGGISRVGNTWWQGQYLPNSVGITNRAGLSTAILRVTTGAGGEAPTFIVMNPANFASILSDFIAAEQYVTGPGKKYGEDDVINSSFRGVSIMGVPVIYDPFCPLGEMYMINTRYTALYLSEYAPFIFSGFESTIPLGQIASIGVLITALDLVCSKPSSGAHFTGLGSGAWSTLTTPAVL